MDATAKNIDGFGEININKMMHDELAKGNKVAFTVADSDKKGDDEPQRSADDLELFRKRMLEDDRMDAIFRATQNMTEKFDNRTYLHPHGMTDFDYKCIDEYRRSALEKFKYKTRHENYKYLGEHYELDAMLNIFFKRLLEAHPDDVVHFAAEFFTRETTAVGFQELLEEEKAKLSRYRVAKMKAAGKITTNAVQDLAKVEAEIKKVEYHRCNALRRPTPVELPPAPMEIIDPETHYKKLQDDVLNWLKKLNIGPLAQDIGKTKTVMDPCA